MGCDLTWLTLPQWVDGIYGLRCLNGLSKRLACSARGGLSQPMAYLTCLGGRNRWFAHGVCIVGSNGWRTASGQSRAMAGAVVLCSQDGWLSRHGCVVSGTGWHLAGCVVPEQGLHVYFGLVNISACASTMGSIRGWLAQQN